MTCTAIRLIGSLLLWTALLGAAAASAQVLRVAELTSEEIHALDRATTVVILPGGILEQHGPHLPSFSDGYVNRAYAVPSPRRSPVAPAGVISSSP